MFRSKKDKKGQKPSFDKNKKNEGNINQPLGTTKEKKESEKAFVEK